MRQGVNEIIARRLGLQDGQVLDTKRQVIKQLHFYVPVAEAEKVKQALLMLAPDRSGSIRNAVSARKEQEPSSRGYVQSYPG